MFFVKYININRYTKEERASASVEELKDCNKVCLFLKYYIIMHQHTKSFFCEIARRFRLAGWRCSASSPSWTRSTARTPTWSATSPPPQTWRGCSCPRTGASSQTAWRSGASRFNSFFWKKNSIAVMKLGRLKLNPYSTQVIIASLKRKGAVGELRNA